MSNLKLSHDPTQPHDSWGCGAERGRAGSRSPGRPGAHPAGGRRPQRGHNIWTLRRFEAIGKLAFDALIRVAVVLDAIEAFGVLFPEPEFRSLDEVIDRSKRQRSKRRTVAK